MPPKKKADTSKCNAMFVGMTALPFWQVSMAQDSSWREIDDDHTENLAKTVIYAGEYGSSNVVRASLLCSGSGEILESSVDGKPRLRNGKHLMYTLRKALQDIKEDLKLDAEEFENYVEPGHISREEYELVVSDNDLADEVCIALAKVMDLKKISDTTQFFVQYEWLNAPLRKHLTKGYDDKYAYADNEDRMLHLTDMALTHEEDKIKVRFTTMKDVQKLGKAMYEQYKDWKIVEKEWQKIAGDHRRSTVQRWIVLARDLDIAICEMLSKRNKIPHKYALENKYLVGHKDQRLDSTYARVAISQVFEKLDTLGDRAVSANVFSMEYCQPYKYLQDWEGAMRQHYGTVCNTFRAFDAVLDDLKTESGRQNILAAMRDRSRLQNAIPRVAAVVEEMKKIKAGTNLSNRGADVSPAIGLEDSFLGAPEVNIEGNTSKLDKDEDENFEVEIMGEGLVEECEDPVHVKAKDLTAVELVHIQVHTKEADFLRDMESRILPSTKYSVYIDCATSKTPVVHKFLDIVQSKCERASKVWIPTGSRFALVGNLMEKIRPDREPYVLQLTRSKNTLQTSRSRPKYGVLGVLSGSTSTANVPVSVSYCGSRAKAHECLNEACDDPLCRFRSGGEAVYGRENKSEDKGLSNDDKVVDEGDEDAFLSGEDEDEDEVERLLARKGECLLSAKEGEAVGKSSLYTFSNPKAFYKRMLVEVLGAMSHTHIVVMTRTAHPGLLVAARELGLEVIAFVQDQPQHSLKHGAHTMQNMMMVSQLQKAKQALPVTQKVCTAKDLQFISVPAPDETTIRICDTSVSEGSAWRGGFNKLSAGLDTKMGHLLQHELDAHGLYLKPHDVGLALYTHGSIGEGEKICNVSALLYDSLGSLLAFLNSKGNRVLADAMFDVPEVLSDSSDVKSSLYAVAVGVARYARAYGDVERKRPNAIIVADPTKGPNDGFLSLVVKTRNISGITKKTPIAIDPGLIYDKERARKYSLVGADEDGPLKKFKSSLDSWLEKAKTPVEEIVSQMEHDDGVAPAKRMKLESAQSSGKHASLQSSQPNEDEKNNGSDSQAGSGQSRTGGAVEVANNAEVEKPLSKDPDTASSVKQEIRSDEKKGTGTDDTTAATKTSLFKYGKSETGHLEVGLGDVTICTEPGVNTNKKVSPGTPVMVFRAGKLKKNGMLEWKFTPDAKIFLRSTDEGSCGAGDSISLMALAKRRGVLGIHKYPEVFSKPGEVPLSLGSPAETLFYYPGADEVDVLKKLAGLSCVTIAWLVGVNTDKKMIPLGVVATIGKQQIMPAGGVKLVLK